MKISGLKFIPIFLLAFILGCGVFQINVPSAAKIGAVSNTITFSGYEWTTKSSTAEMGPGPNYFSDSTDNLWVDAEGRLHLKITKQGDRWYCAELYSKSSLGYGKYTFSTVGRVDALDKNAVLGFFTWDDDSAYHNREMDIEFTRWANETLPNLNYTVQLDNTHTKEITLEADDSTHSFNWTESSVTFESRSEVLIDTWTYAGADVPKSGNEKVRINLWLKNTYSPSDQKEVEVIIGNFEFTVN